MVAREAIREQGVQERSTVAYVLAALALAACHPPSAKSQGAPSSAAPQGPVNPDAGVTTYKCVDGSSIVAGYPDPDTAVVTYKDHAYTLKRVPSDAGARYTGYGLQWRTNGAHGSIAAEDKAAEPGLDCVAAQDQPASNPVTRTAFRPSSP